MKVKEKIGIVGQGYVGTAIKVGFDSYYSLETYDKFDDDKSTCDLNQLVAENQNRIKRIFDNIIVLCYHTYWILKLIDFLSEKVI